jgi:acyl dehydratase
VAFLGVREWKFTGVVFPGDTVRVKTKVVHKELRGRGKRGEVHWLRTMLNQEDKVVQEGVTITLVECRRSEEKTNS